MNLDKEQLPVVHVGVCEDYPRLRDKNPLLIGRTESMPLCKRNRLHVWTYYLSNDANGYHRSQLPPATVPPSSERGALLKDVGSEEAGTVKSMWGVTGRLVAMVLYKGPRLLDLAKTPEHLQFNKYVLTGYRPVSTVQECLRSLFYVHNELGNIYTHGESSLELFAWPPGSTSTPVTFILVSLFKNVHINS